MCGRLIELCQRVRFARAEFELLHDASDHIIAPARRTAGRSAMDFGSGRRDPWHQCVWATTRRATTVLRSTSGFWQKYSARLGEIGERFAAVLIEHRPLLADSHRSQ